MNDRPLARRRAVALSALVAACALSTGCAELKILRERVAYQEQEIAKLRTQKGDFQKSYDEARDAHAAELRAYEERLETLDAELAALRQGKSEREKELEEKLFQYETEGARKTDAALSQAAELDTQLAAAEVGQTALKQQVVDAQQALAAAEAKIAAAEAEVVRLTAANAELKAKSEELARATDSLAKAQAELDETKAALAKARESDADLSGDPALAEAAIALANELKGADGGSEISIRHDARGLRILLPTSLVFDSGTVIVSSKAETALQVVALFLRNELPGRLVRIEGHTDDQPTVNLPFADNWGLGAARADRVRQFLCDEAGLEARRVEIATRASHDPLGGDREKDRRVEIVVGQRLKQ